MIFSLPICQCTCEIWRWQHIDGIIKVSRKAWVQVNFLLNRHWRNNSQLIEQDKFSYYFAKGGGKFQSLTLVTQNGVCINSWLMLQMETRTQIHIKLRITSSICWMWVNISSKSHCTFTLLLKSFLGKTLKLWAHGQQPTSQRRSELLMDVTL